jgi:hypothetical protein
VVDVLRLTFMKLVFTLLLFTFSTLAQTAHSNTLTWAWSQGAGDAATGFHIWKSATTPVSTTGTPYATVGSPTILTYVDSSVVAGQTNFYVVTAFNTGGESTPSNQVTCVTPFQAPNPPTGLSATVK